MQDADNDRDDDWEAEHRREVEQLARDPELFPEFTHFPVSAIFTCLPVPKGPQPPPEYVYVAAPRRGDGDTLAYQGALAQWNLAWESGAWRHHLFAAELHPRLEWLKRYAGRNPPAM